MNIEELSRFVFRFNYRDKFSEDYVYFQIISYLAEHGSFTISELDKKVLFKKENNPNKTFRIERRKLKNIIYGTDKNYEGLIPLNYIKTVDPSRYRGGYPETNYYLTEKGIMASLGFSSYKENINIKKFKIFFDDIYGKPFNKFAFEFMKLQIHIFLLYHYIQGISLEIKHDYDDYYNEFRKMIVQPFHIRVSNIELENEFFNLLQKLNIYRKIHSHFLDENILLKLIWKEPYGNKIPYSGFEGWYRIIALTMLDKNLKSKSNPVRRKPINRRDELKLKREFIYVGFQNYSKKIPQSAIEHEMKLLGIKTTSTTKFNSQTLYSERLNYEKKFLNKS